jgi:cbb3-type cytochrome oxidase maturation protein
MELIHFLVPAGIVFLSGSAILAFYWAVKTGQFRHLEKGATVIFDEDEPIGKPTESFPDRKMPSRTPKL